METKLLTPAEVAERLRVTERTVYMWLREAKLPGRKLGKLWRIRPEDLDTFLEEDAWEPDDELSPEDLAAAREGIEAIRRGQDDFAR